MTSIRQIGIGSASALILGTIGYYSVQAMESKNRWGMYVFLFSIFFVFSLEAYDRGCTWKQCTLNTSITQKFQSAQELACWERNRVRWRISFLIASIFFLCLTLAKRTKLLFNVIVSLLVFFIHYLENNFNAYHHMGKICKTQMLRT